MQMGGGHVLYVRVIKVYPVRTRTSLHVAVLRRLYSSISFSFVFVSWQLMMEIDCYCNGTVRMTYYVPADVCVNMPTRQRMWSIHCDGCTMNWAVKRGAHAHAHVPPRHRHRRTRTLTFPTPSCCSSIFSFLRIAYWGREAHRQDTTVIHHNFGNRSTSRHVQQSRRETDRFCVS
jgi:hypothetical protein